MYNDYHYYSRFELTLMDVGLLDKMNELYSDILKEICIYSWWITDRDVDFISEEFKKLDKKTVTQDDVLKIINNYDSEITKVILALRDKKFRLYKDYSEFIKFSNLKKLDSSKILNGEGNHIIEWL